MARTRAKQPSLRDELESKHGKTPFVVIFDCESDCDFKNCPGIDRDSKLSRMQCTIACAIVIESTKCLQVQAENVESAVTHWHFWRHLSPGGRPPFDGLLWLFDHAEVIVAYNALDFDFPLLRKHYTTREQYLAHRLKCLDPFARIRSATEVWPSLDALLKANGLQGKSGSGLDAIFFYAQGKMDELKKYCEDDVLLLTRLVFLPALTVPSVGGVPAHLTNILTAIAASRFPSKATEPSKSAKLARPPPLPEEDEGFVLL
tara:strand:- start:344 stop:1123 length:780 start_codon:yes stop_codon:yes gene_type:complete